jgi:hypothetical protein
VRSTSPLTPRRSPLLTGLMVLYLVYSLVPLLWLILSATKVEKKRRPTKPTLGSKKRRLESKTKRGSIKAGRGKVDF